MTAALIKDKTAKGISNRKLSKMISPYIAYIRSYRQCDNSIDKKHSCKYRAWGGGGKEKWTMSTGQFGE